MHHLSFPLVVCADDFGLSPGINSAILNLVAASAINATSVMSGQPFWNAEAASALRAVAGATGAEVGLHLTLTDQQPAYRASRLATGGLLPSLPLLLARAWAGALNLRAVQDELLAQWERFEALWGRAPDFIDGHQHVHLLPGVREVVAALLEKRYRGSSFWVRSTVDRPAAILRRGVAPPKALFLALLGKPWAQLIKRHRWRSNEGFAGVRSFKERQPFRALFRAFLHAPGSRHLIFVHPALPDKELQRVEAVVEARYEEYRYLTSADYRDDLAAAGAFLASSWRFSAPL